MKRHIGVGLWRDAAVSRCARAVAMLHIERVIEPAPCTRGTGMKDQRCVDEVAWWLRRAITVQRGRVVHVYN
jgi:hypothetical protein